MVWTQKPVYWRNHGHPFFSRYLDRGTGQSIKKRYSQDEINGSLVVCAIDAIGMRHFGLFRNYIDFGIFMVKNFPDERERTFFEVQPSTAQKPHFDLEVEPDPKTGMFPQDIASVIENLLTCIEAVLSERGVNLNFETDILMYNSSGSHKQSAHIVINNWCHSDNIEAKAFYKEVTQLMRPELSPFVDPAVYSQLQQFRIIGNQKLNSGRPKRFVPTFTWQGKSYTHKAEEEADGEGHRIMIELGESLLGNVKYCSLLPIFSKMEKDENGNYIRTRKFGTGELEADENMIDGIMAMIGSSVRISPDAVDFPFEFKEIRDGFILLNLLKPYRCQLCRRVHENENPYVFVTKDKTVFFNCRRHEKGATLNLGQFNDKGCIQESLEIKYDNAATESKPKPKVERLVRRARRMFTPPKNVVIIDPANKPKFITADTFVSSHEANPVSPQPTFLSQSHPSSPGDNMASPDVLDTVEETGFSGVIPIIPGVEPMTLGGSGTFKEEIFTLFDLPSPVIPEQVKEGFHNEDISHIPGLGQDQSTVTDLYYDCDQDQSTVTDLYYDCDHTGATTNPAPDNADFYQDLADMRTAANSCQEAKPKPKPADITVEQMMFTEKPYFIPETTKLGILKDKRDVVYMKCEISPDDILMAKTKEEEEEEEDPIIQMLRDEKLEHLYTDVLDPTHLGICSVVLRDDSEQDFDPTSGSESDAFTMCSGSEQEYRPPNRNIELLEAMRNYQPGSMDFSSCINFTQLCEARDNYESE